MLNIKCDFCNKWLKEPGALLFSIPKLKKHKMKCKKFHICKLCYKQKIKIHVK